MGKYKLAAFVFVFCGVATFGMAVVASIEAVCFFSVANLFGVGVASLCIAAMASFESLAMFSAAYEVLRWSYVSPDANHTR